MPLIIQNYTPLFDKEGNIGLTERLKGSVQYGLSWFQEIEAQKPIVERMKALFNDRFTLIQNYTIPDSEVQVPFILLGQGGLRVISTSRLEGIFETQGEEWLALDPKTQEFEPSNPNIVRQAIENHRAVVEFLSSHNVDPNIHSPVLLLTNTGIDLTVNESPLRIVRMDALKRYLQSIVVEEGELTKLDINYIAQIFERAVQEKKREIQIQPERKPLPNPFGNFTTIQWIIVGGILIINIILILVIAALYYSLV